MKKSLIGFLTACVIACELAPISSVSAGNDIGQANRNNAYMTGAEQCEVGLFEIKDTDPLIEESEFGVASGKTKATDAATPMPFYNYSNDHYGHRYSYGSGYGYAFNYIIDKNRPYQTQKLWLYNRLLELCREFSTDYSDVPLYVLQLGGGQVSPDMYRIGNQNIELSLAGTGIDITADATSREIAANIVYETYFTFRNDHPEYYWLSGMAYVFWSGSNNSVMFVPQVFEDFRSGRSRQAMDERMQASIDKFLDGVYTSDYYSNGVINSYYVCALLRNMLTASTKYGYESDGVTPLDTGTAHSIVSVFDADDSTDAVCEGYAKSFQLLLNKLGIDNIYVTGTAGSKNEHHAWNMVKMPDGMYYYFDITWEDFEPYNYFAFGSHDAAEVGGGHVLDTSTAYGERFLYDVPEVPVQNYGGGSIADVGCPELLPFAPLETFTPEPYEYGDFSNARSIRISTLAWEKYDSYYFNHRYGDILTWNVTVTSPDGEPGVYGTDFVAYYDNKLLDEQHYEYTYITEPVSYSNNKIAGYYKGNAITADDIKSKLIIFANPGVTITVMPQYFDLTGSGVYSPDQSLKKSRTIGAPTPVYARIELSEIKDKICKTNEAKYSNYIEFVGVDIDIYEDESTTTEIDYRNEYNDQYMAIYNGHELIYPDYANCLLKKYLSSVFENGTTFEDIINGLALRVRPGRRLRIRAMYTMRDITTGDIIRNPDGTAAYYYIDRAEDIIIPNVIDETPEPEYTVPPIVVTQSPTPTRKPTPTPVIRETVSPEPASGKEGSYLDLVPTGSVKTITGAFRAIYGTSKKVINHSEAHFAVTTNNMSIWDDQAKDRSIYTVYDVLVNVGDKLTLSVYNGNTENSPLGPGFMIAGNADGTATASYTTSVDAISLGSGLVCGTWYRVLIEMPIGKASSAQNKLDESIYTIYRIDPGNPSNIKEIAAQAKNIAARSLYNKTPTHIHAWVQGTPYVDNGAVFIGGKGLDLISGYPAPTQTPTPTPISMPTTTPEPWIGSVRISDMYIDYISPRYPDYVSTNYLQINVTVNGNAAVYGTDYIAVNNGIRLTSFQPGTIVDGKTTCRNLEIYGVKGVTVEVKPIVTNQSGGGLYSLPESVGRSVTIGKNIIYTYVRIPENMNITSDPQYPFEIVRPYFVIKTTDGSIAKYGTDYVAEYDGRLLYEMEYTDIVMGYKDSVLGESVAWTEVYDKLVIKAIDALDIEFDTIIRYNGSEGRLGPVNAKDFPKLYSHITVDAPLNIGITLQRIGKNIFVSADGAIPKDCAMYIAVYDNSGVLRSVKHTSDKSYMYVPTDGDARLKAFIFDKNQSPVADAQQIWL